MSVSDIHPGGAYKAQSHITHTQIWGVSLAEVKFTLKFSTVEHKAKTLLTSVSKTFASGKFASWLCVFGD